MGIKVGIDESISVLVAGGELTLPVTGIVDRFVAELGGLPAQEQGTPRIFRLPALGAKVSGEGGAFGGLARGPDGKLRALIVATDPRGSFKEVPLGTYNVKVAGADSRWDGMANTQALAAAGSEICQRLLQLEIEGKRDYFLMSAGDGHVLACTIPELFDQDDYHWTSTQYSAAIAFVQGFKNGFQSLNGKDFTRRVRAVRAIQLDALTL